MSEPTTLHNVLTIDQFHAADVSAILDAHPYLVLNDLRHPLRAAAVLASAKGRDKQAAILGLMSDICSMMLQPSVYTAPLAPFANWDDGIIGLAKRTLGSWWRP